MRFSHALRALVVVVAGILATQPVHAQEDSFLNGQSGEILLRLLLGDQIPDSGRRSTPDATTEPDRRDARERDRAHDLWPGIESRQGVRRVQRALNALGYGAGPEDGLMGARTRSAIRSFQRRRNDPATGRLTTAQAEALFDAAGLPARDTRPRLPANLPAVVRARAESQAAYCRGDARTLLSRRGVLSTADINDDGVTDYVLDWSAANCRALCGARGCEVEVIASRSGYRVNRFEGRDVRAGDFICTADGACRRAAGGDEWWQGRQ